MYPPQECIEDLEFISSLEKSKVDDMEVDTTNDDKSFEDCDIDTESLILLAEEENFHKEEQNECPFDNEGNGCACTDVLESATEEFPCPIIVDLTPEFTNNETYETLEEAKAWIKGQAERSNIVINIAKSDYSENRNPYIYFGCERGGKHRNHQKGGVYNKKKDGTGKSAPRNSSTRKCDCPFIVKCMMNRNDGLWRFNVINGEHNYRLTKNRLGHAFSGRLSQEEKDEVRSMSKNNIKPRNILRHLREKNLNSCTLPKTIYNVRSYLKKKELDGRSIIQEIFNQADESNTFIWHTRDGDVLENIFWASNESIQLLNSFPSVLMIDCTYKTNRYKMPLLHIVGVTSTQKSFSAAFALLSSEKEKTYTWAMQMLQECLKKCNIVPKCIVTDREIALMKAIARVFPTSKQLLCRWHIAMNVSKCIKSNVEHEKYKPLINKWNAIQNCQTTDEIKDLLEEVKVENKVVGAYMESWVSDYKEIFVSGWIDEIFHLGNTSTSRVEGVHPILKNWIGTSTCDMATHWNAIVAMVDDQVHSIKALFQTSLIMVPKAYIDMTWCNLLKGYVSIHALDLIREEMDRILLVGDDPVRCRCVLRKTKSLPCAHEISLLLKRKSTIPIEAIHIHWRTLSMDRPPNISDILDPRPLLSQFLSKFESESTERKMEMIARLREVIDPKTTTLKEPAIILNTRGRPKGALGKRKLKNSQNEDESTKREPSDWEYVKERENVKVDARVCHQLIEHIPKVWHPYVKEVYDVEGDGNCGFRVVALGIGLEQKDWPTIRMDLWKELKEKKELFSDLMPLKDRPEQILRHLIWGTDTGKCPPAKWMVAPDTLWVVAELYGVAVSLLSSSLSVTCVPITKAPSFDQPGHIWIVNVENVHFVWAKMTYNCPIPPIFSPWKASKYIASAGWATLYKDRIESGKKLLDQHRWETVHKNRLNEIYDGQVHLIN